MMCQNHYPEKVKELEALAEEARKDLGDDITGNPVPIDESRVE